jgi:NADP-dependent 3-hydroxy acid dehydrogenase YdfG
VTRPLAVITGASSGIGEASAVALADAGFTVLLGARRVDLLSSIANRCGGEARALDVTDPSSVAAFVEGISECALLVNNAGGAIGARSIANADESEWQAMFDTNVLGTLRMTRALLPALVASGDGQVITIGSIAAREPYAGGGGYNAAKHAVAAMTRVLRIEMLGQPIRVAEIDPGMVETEFSLRRFDGDAEKAAAIYAGMNPLQARDIAEAVAWVATRPSRVNIDTMTILARDQTSAQVVHRT